jgi:cobalamin biosynthesis protein CobT
VPTGGGCGDDLDDGEEGGAVLEPPHVASQAPVLASVVVPNILQHQLLGVVVRVQKLKIQVGVSYDDDDDEEEEDGDDDDDEEEEEEEEDDDNDDKKDEADGDEDDDNDDDDDEDDDDAADDHDYDDDDIQMMMVDRGVPVGSSEMSLCLLCICVVFVATASCITIVC